MEPFDTLRDCLPNWTIAFSALDGVMGFTDVEHKTIWIDIGLPFRQWRTTGLHEVLHAIRGDSHDDPAAELAVRLETARRLISIGALVAALTLSLDIEDVLDHLEVDVGALRTRIRHLKPDEASSVRRVLTRHLGRSPTYEHGCAITRWWRQQHQPEPAPTFHDHPDLIRFGPVRMLPDCSRLRSDVQRPPQSLETDGGSVGPIPARTSP